MGLDRLHQLTNSNDYKLKITLTDFDSKQYVAVYEDFKVTKSFLSAFLLAPKVVLDYIRPMITIQPNPNQSHPIHI